MNHGRLFSAGVIGGVASSVLAAALRTAGVPVDLELWLGAVLLAPGGAALFVGFFLHLTLSGLLAIGYGRAFVLLARSGPGVGARVAVAHAALSGVWLGLMPALHPRVPEVLDAPGFFLANAGVAGVSAFVALHLAFGAVVGAFAEPVAARIGVTRRSRVFHTSSPPRPASAMRA